MTEFVGIVGAGCALAYFLKTANIDYIVFDDNQRPDIIVGKSLLAAIIPSLKRLGIEKRVAEVAIQKRGVALQHSDGNRIDFKFKRFGFNYVSYSYNVQCPEFDLIIRQRAEELGIKFVNFQAKVEKNTDDTDRNIQLCDATLAMAGLTRINQLSLLVDATSRARLFSKTLKMSSLRGNRNDVSYFAHYKNFTMIQAFKGK